jgi:hypothetical protein
MLESLASSNAITQAFIFDDGHLPTYGCRNAAGDVPSIGATAPDVDYLATRLTA